MNVATYTDDRERKRKEIQESDGQNTTLGVS